MANSILEKRGGDFVVHVESFQKCFDTVTVTLAVDMDSAEYAGGVAGTPGTITAGAFTPVAVAAQGTADAFLVSGPGIAQGTAAGAAINDGAKYTAINVYDGAVLNQDALKSEDPAAAAYTAATIIANVTAAKWVTESTKKSEQQS